MAEVKEELNEGVDTQVEEVVSTETTEQEEENTDDYFNPFPDKKDEVIEEKVEKKEDEEVETEPIKEDSGIELEYQADKQASREVREYVKENPLFADYADELAEIASKAIQRGHSKPVEFAIRNLKSPQEWIELGKKSGESSAVNVLKTRVGGSSVSSGDKGTPDYNNMKSADFNKLVNKVKNS